MSDLLDDLMLERLPRDIVCQAVQFYFWARQVVQGYRNPGR